MIRCVLVVLLALLPLPPLFGQGGAVQAPLPQIRELFKLNEIPGISKSVVKTHGPYVGQGIPENVVVDVLESQAPQGSMMFVRLLSGERAQLYIRSVDVTLIQRFTMNGHVFGYLIEGIVADFDEQGRRIHFGSAERAYYYDPDGTGKFTVMRDVGGEMNFKIIVPKWVKQSPPQ
jgi:hypothetical protein